MRKKHVRRFISLCIAAALCLLLISCGRPAGNLLIHSPFREASLALPIAVLSADYNDDRTSVRFKSRLTLEKILEKMADGFPPLMSATNLGSGVLFSEKVDDSTSAPVNYFFLCTENQERKKKLVAKDLRTLKTEKKRKSYVLTAMQTAFASEDEAERIAFLFPLHLISEAGNWVGKDALPLDTPLATTHILSEFLKFYEEAKLYNCHIRGNELILNGYQETQEAADSFLRPQLAQRIVLRLEGSGDAATLTVTLREGAYVPGAPAVASQTQAQ
ncbi:MAG: hypothetical protein LBQ33_01545 [Oscillospiraceae bacterium]|jgi:hypothetical protein|nr:hypothetical protein [Oscillospiraceae bacterium]